MRIHSPVFVESRTTGGWDRNGTELYRLMYLEDVLAAAHLEGPSLLGALGPVLLRVVVRDAVGRHLVALHHYYTFY